MYMYMCVCVCFFLKSYLSGSAVVCSEFGRLPDAEHVHSIHLNDTERQCSRYARNAPFNSRYFYCPNV